MQSEPKSGVELIAAERLRQVSEEGRSASHDDCHATDEIACAAACYAMPERFRAIRKRGLWRWGAKWWKPTPDNRVRELVKAGALIAAEIDRLQRKAAIAAFLSNHKETSNESHRHA